jgi:hypothetical protein
MKTIPFELFPVDEQEIFIASCRRAGKSQKEFIVRAEEEDPIPGSAQPARREVIVKHVPTGNAMRYNAGPGTNWDSAFLDDLVVGFFRVGIVTGLDSPPHQRT